MVFPYRTPASIDPDPTPPGRSKTLDRWVRAVSGAAVIFLLAASATMFAMIHDLVRSRQFQGDPASNHLARSTAVEAAREPSQLRAPPAPACAALPPREAPLPRAFVAPLGLASLGATTHDPTVLLARATRLRQDGADLTLTRSLLPMPVDRALAEAFAPHARIAARFAAGGIEIQSLPAGSTASLAGLQRGDVVTAVNGQALTRPESALDAYSSVLATGIAVIEVIRGERRIVLEARFSPTSPRGPIANHGPL
jgi:membrane-associated protease RseP (regulator of RpoE activity)